MRKTFRRHCACLSLVLAALFFSAPAFSAPDQPTEKSADGAATHAEAAAGARKRVLTDLMPAIAGVREANKKDDAAEAAYRRALERRDVQGLVNALRDRVMARRSGLEAGAKLLHAACVRKGDAKRCGKALERLVALSTEMDDALGEMRMAMGRGPLAAEESAAMLKARSDAQGALMSAMLRTLRGYVDGEARAAGELAGAFPMDALSDLAGVQLPPPPGSMDMELGKR